MDDIRISDLPYVGYTGYNPGDLFVNVNNDVTKNTTLEDIKTFILNEIPIPDSISSGPTAPGTAVVANETDVDINFSDGVGTAWSFSSTGLTFPDNTIQTTAYTGGTGSSGISPTIGSWTLSPGANTVSFTVTAGQSYVMWVNGNIPNGIVNWNATVTLSNSNVPAIGVQYGWYYLAGNQLVLTSIPSQIVGTAGVIITTSPAVSNSNTFTFGITNNTVSSQIVYYGYIKIS
jgi:hypothetical protein